ncbi:MAG TPA: cupredoxin domain-containing protein [Nitrososphaera sp.]
MPKTGKVAFSVILGLGAAVGVLSFILFSMVSPGPLLSSAGFQQVPYEGPAVGEIGEGGGETTPETAARGGGGSAGNSTGQNQSAAIPQDAVVISILQGSSVQGNPSYDPERAEVPSDKTIAWKNDDSVPHTATSGELFDSSIINPGESFTIAAQEIGTGEHEYACTVHPYMKGTLAIK